MGDNLKIAIISVSKKGFALACVLKEKLDKDSTIIKTDLYHKDVKNTFRLIFDEYDAIISIMATGILIRSIAQLVKSKDRDPAIVNIDDNGQFAISILSGHLGGANKLTDKISKLINAQEVITTSTDINNKLGIDVLANDLYLSIDDKKEILYFNKAILEGREISITINPNKNYEYLFKYLNDNTLEIDVSIYYSSKIDENEIHIDLDNHKIILKEKKIVVGIGCRRNKKCREIYNAFMDSINKLKISKSRVNILTSAEIKKDEQGLIEMSNKLDIPINFVEMDKMRLFTSQDISKSDFVMSKFGIYGVCEPAALITAGYNSKLIYKKTSYNGVTIAISVGDESFEGIQ